LADLDGGAILLPIPYAQVQEGLHDHSYSRKEMVDTKVYSAETKGK
jgi:hypothetical protein